MGRPYHHVAAIVLNWNAPDETLGCLESLAASDWPRLTIIAVDNGSEKDIGSVVRERFPGTLTVQNDDNLGFSGGMNVGMRRAFELGVDYLLLLNNDTRVDPGMVRILVETALSHPDAGMVCPLILYRDRPGMVLSAGLRCDLRRGYQGKALGMGQNDRGQFDGVREVAAPSGAAMLVPAEVVAAVGMLDEELFLYGEDVEWAQRMQASGLRVYVSGRARVWHGLLTSSGGACSPLSSYYQTRNSFVVRTRHAPMHGPRALVRGADIVLANLIYTRHAQRPLVNVRAVLAGWRDYRRGRLGRCPSGALSLHNKPIGAEVGPPIVISAGFSKTHMTTAAREVLDREQLAIAITGAYPTKRVQWIARLPLLANRARIGRLLDRGEQIPAERLRALLVPELLFEVARLIGRLPGGVSLFQQLGAAMWRLYGWQASQQLRRASPTTRVYHFRAGFGQASIERARARGMHVVCDHAIAHPLLLEGLVASRGKSLAQRNQAGWPGIRSPRSALEQAILRDIDRSDSVLVNSHFVKETFLACGWPADRVHVVYLGVDDNFLGSVGDVQRHPSDGPLRLLFAGRLERRKGADVLVEALSGLKAEPWELVIAGPITPEIRRHHAEFLENPSVTVLGPMRRAELAQEMLAAPVFVFPSYAEGSARVVFEALACGCYVITTSNSGTIVEEGVHGALVPPGESEPLAAAILAASGHRRRVAEIGARNAMLIRARYRQKDYGDALASVYGEIMRSRPISYASPVAVGVGSS